MAYEILVLDIDGTLTNSQKEISNNTLNAILNIQERGHIVVLASGRPTPGILELSAKLQLAKYNGYILSYNGGKIIHCASNEIIFQKVLDQSVIAELYQDALEHKVGIITYENNSIIAGTKTDEYMLKESNINKIPIKEVPNFIDYVTFDVNKCLMTGESSHLAYVEEQLKRKYENKLSIYRSEPYFLEIMPKGIDKAKSLSKLLDHLNLTKEQLICCGDGYNDLTMIEYAGLGVAMENANDDVKKVADFITHSNDNDGVVHVINQFLL